MIRKCLDSEIEIIYEIINDASIAYQDVIPPDRWKQPYMEMDELKEQIADGVAFCCYVENNEMVGVMGIQNKGDVKLIRHSYVRTRNRNGGIGTKLLNHLLDSQEKPILIGTWKDAVWAIDFYTKNGFRLVEEEEKNMLLKKYWKIPERQVETSVVLVDAKYK
ncbi:GNAT family N-acetyltransferase [Dysgonomonas sp. ZJ709]|uniref:GNAT family N-acetyltransferase n=1 Tax=Dysgonomonas sp. ZJ709 TaxID=2709797 RepID=UPI0013EDCA9E|nr:GNAT family N-acetyltransferase [Dysgonomonas sp. ZJ709]